MLDAWLLSGKLVSDRVMLQLMQSCYAIEACKHDELVMVECTGRHECACCLMKPMCGCMAVLYRTDSNQIDYAFQLEIDISYGQFDSGGPLQMFPLGIWPQHLIVSCTVVSFC